MNHEPHPSNNPDRYQPRHRVDHELEAAEMGQAPYDADSDNYIRHVVEHAPTAEVGALIARLYRRHGSPFAAYLTLDSVNAYFRDNGDGPMADQTNQLETDFKDAYYGHFPDREALVDDTIASFDWGSEADRLLDGHVQLSQFLVFDRSAIYEFASDHYEVIHTDEGLYVFWR
ncbi:MAG: hypothetical protein NTX33_00115 [Propionibacteriales bacterium]|nr:hypothetical protein [Propionibacteriales bacterium]